MVKQSTPRECSGKFSGMKKELKNLREVMDRGKQYVVCFLLTFIGVNRIKYVLQHSFF